MANRVIDLGLVRGPQGPQGEVGPVGPQGPKGDKGDTGVLEDGLLELHMSPDQNGGVITFGPGLVDEDDDDQIMYWLASIRWNGSKLQIYAPQVYSSNLDTNAITASTLIVGQSNTVSGQHGVALGLHSVSSGFAALSAGAYSTASNYCSFACGKRSQAMTDGGSGSNQVGDAFVIGNGTSTTARSNAFRVTYAGTVYGKGSFQTSGADYAEYFEWADDNPQGQDRVGYFVTLEGSKIKLAGPGDYILGIVSANPCIIGNADEDWLGRQLHDQFGRFIKEYLETDETEVVIPDGLEGEELLAYLQENNIQERDGVYIQETTRVVDYETPSWRYKENPDYDPSQPYVERKDRAEWDAIGMLGVLAVRDDGTCQVNGFCQVGEGGVATAAEVYVPGLTWRVIERVNEGVVKVVFR